MKRAKIVGVAIVFGALPLLLGGCALVIKALTADFTATPTVGAAALTVQFLEQVTIEPAHAPYKVLWDFGDGTTSTEHDPVHVYRQPGFYTVTLTVTAGHGNLQQTVTETKADYIKVASPGGYVPPPPAGTGSAADINAAIDSAGPEGLVLVGQGTYAGDVVVDRNGVTVRAVPGETPVVEGSLIVDADSVTVQDFEITGDLETTPFASFANLTLVNTLLYGEIFDTTLTCDDVVNDGESIQASIDAASGGEIVCVGPGTYVEQLLIGKDLTLRGLAGPPLIRAPNSATRNTYTFPESGAAWDPIVFAYGGTLTGGDVSGSNRVNVTISGLEIDGQEDFGSSSTRYVGILYRNVDGAISHNIVRDLGRDGTQTFGILVYGDSTVTIANNAVSNYGRGGIGANGDLDTSSFPYPLGPLPDPVVTIQGNTVVGPGATAPQTWASNGIQIGWGATGSIEANEVSGNGWPGTEWTGTGIIVVDSNNVLIRGNNVHDNESAIIVGQFYNPASGIEVRGNIVDNNVWGIQVINDASHTVVEGNAVTNNSGDGVDVWTYAVFGWSWVGEPTNTAVHDNNIAGNGYDGAWTNITAEAVDMTNNWWGSPDGPADAANDAGEAVEVPPCTDSPASEINADPSGSLGDSVGDTSTEVIDYCPWLSAAASAPAVQLRAPTGPPVTRSELKPAQPVE